MIIKLPALKHYP